MSRSLLAAIGVCCLVLAGTAPDAQERDRVSRMVTEAEAPSYQAVGRLNVAGSRYCTATLISPQLVLTAAHCLFNPVTGRRAEAHEMMFVAGQRGETYAALRGVLATATLPAYRFRRLPSHSDPRNDVALLLLKTPVPADLATAVPVGAWDGIQPLSLAAFGRDRAFIASLRENCRSDKAEPALVVLDCPVVPGVSGAPALYGGENGLTVVGVVSSARSGDASAVVVRVTPELLDELKTALTGPLL